MVPADSDGITRVPPYSGYQEKSILFRLQDYHPLRLAFPDYSTIIKIDNFMFLVLQPQSKDWFGLFPFRSPLLGESIFFLFLFLLRCFSSEGYFLISYGFTYWYLRITTSEFPHSEIPGSKITYISPRHFVVCHVLHQLLMPSDPHVRPL